jgi:hypothetical protein
VDNKRKNRLADLAQKATAAALQRLTCPDCSGGIQVQFVPRGRRGKGAGALYVTCPECVWRVINDGLPTEPPWVSELGPKVQTAASVAPRPATSKARA